MAILSLNSVKSFAKRLTVLTARNFFYIYIDFISMYVSQVCFNRKHLKHEVQWVLRSRTENLWFKSVLIVSSGSSWEFVCFCFYKKNFRLILELILKCYICFHGLEWSLSGLKQKYFTYFALFWDHQTSIFFWSWLKTKWETVFVWNSL